MQCPKCSAEVDAGNKFCDERGAQFSLGGMYFEGDGVLEDYDAAYTWTNIAAANGNKFAKEHKSFAQLRSSIWNP